MIDRAMKAFNEMSPDKIPLVINGDCDGLSIEDLRGVLQKADASNGLVIVGNAAPGDRVGVDTYDQIIKFAEDRNFSRIRQRKEDDGQFAVIMVP